MIRGGGNATYRLSGDKDVITLVARVGHGRVEGSMLMMRLLLLLLMVMVRASMMLVRGIGDGMRKQTILVKVGSVHDAVLDK